VIGSNAGLFMKAFINKRIEVRTFVREGNLLFNETIMTWRREILPYAKLGRVCTSLTE
jgi:hypothetical protein